MYVIVVTRLDWVCTDCDCVYHCMQNLKENLGSLKVRLTPEDVAEVRKYADAANATVGDRYPRSLQHSLFIDTPPLQK